MSEPEVVEETSVEIIPQHEDLGEAPQADLVPEAEVQPEVEAEIDVFALSVSDAGVFDPTAALENASDEFVDLIDASGSESSSAAIHDALKREAFKGIDTSSFKEFSTEGRVVTEGSYSFSVEQKFLKEATNSCKAASGAAKGMYGRLKLSIGHKTLKMATFNQAAFSEIMIPLFEPQAEIKEGEEISFIFDQSIMAKIASTFPDSIITFNLVAEKNLLSIHSENTTLELTTYPETEFVSYHNKIGDPVHIGQIDPEAIRRGIKYASIFSTRNEMQVALSTVECRDSNLNGEACGEIVGGNHSAVGVFKSKQIGNTLLKVKFETLTAVERAMKELSPTNTHLFESDSYWIVRDENSCFGFERTKSSFPKTDGFFSLKSLDNTMVPRVALINSLLKLSVVSAERDLLIRLRIAGKASQAKLTLESSDDAGKVSSDTIEVFRSANKGQEATFEEIDSFVNLAQLLKAITHFDYPNVKMDYLAGKAFILTEDGEDFAAYTIMSLMTPEKVSALRQEREKSGIK